MKSAILVAIKTNKTNLKHSFEFRFFFFFRCCYHSRNSILKWCSLPHIYYCPPIIDNRNCIYVYEVHSFSITALYALHVSFGFFFRNQRIRMFAICIFLFGCSPMDKIYINFVILNTQTRHFGFSSSSYFFFIFFVWVVCALSSRNTRATYIG